MYCLRIEIPSNNNIPNKEIYKYRSIQLIAPEGTNVKPVTQACYNIRRFPVSIGNRCHPTISRVIDASGKIYINIRLGHWEWDKWEHIYLYTKPEVKDENLSNFIAVQENNSFSSVI